MTRYTEEEFFALQSASPFCRCCGSVNIATRAAVASREAAGNLRWVAFLNALKALDQVDLDAFVSDLVQWIDIEAVEAEIDVEIAIHDRLNAMLETVDVPPASADWLDDWRDHLHGVPASQVLEYIEVSDEDLFAERKRALVWLWALLPTAEKQKALAYFSKSSAEKCLG